MLPQDTNYSDDDSFLTFVYGSYPEYNNLSNAKITADLSVLYMTMNGKALKEINKMIYTVCDHHRDHEHLSFTTGINLGIRLAKELSN